MTAVVTYEKFEMIDPGALVPYAQNARTHSAEQIEQIGASILEFGFTNPILIAEDGSIIAGHGRALAAQKIGMQAVPCIRLVGLSDSQRRALILADNKLAENAGWDYDLLRLELADLTEAGFDLAVIGFSASEFSDIVLGGDDIESNGETGDDEIPASSAEFVSVRGDIWVCGDHRIMCGDSTVLTHVESLFDRDRADLCWTDPPYNVNYEGAAGKIENDNMGADQFLAFLTDAFTACFAVMKDGASIYVAHADTEGLAFRSSFARAGFKLSGCLVWVKPSLVLGRSDYQWRHEPILYGWKPGAAHRWFGGRAKTTVIDAVDVPFVVNPDGSVQVETGSSTLHFTGSDLMVEEFVGSVIRHEKPAKNGEHPTMKPVGLIIGMLKNSSRRGDIVFDPFGGSGSTLIASEKIGRRARLIELDPRFADVIVRRWQDFTGSKAVLQSSGERFDDLRAKKGRGR